MRITFALLFGFVLSYGAASTALAELPAGSKIHGVFSKDDQQRRTREKEQAAAAEQAAWQAANQPYRVDVWVPESMPTYVQPAGYGYANGYPATYPAPGAEQAVASGPAMPGAVQMAGHGHAVPGNPHMMGGGTFPYGSAYDHGHPGKMFDGGRYGYFGGAHRTPGYPHHHHHFNREYVGPQGPPTAAVAYPYYTVRGPRDFFLDNPPSIGR